MEFSPNAADPYITRATAYSLKEDFDSAIEDCKSAIERDPNAADAYLILGMAFSNKNDFDLAIANYTEARNLQPNYLNAYYERGNAHSNRGDFNKAIADYTKVIELNPHHSIECYFNRGIAYSKKRQCDKAIADYSTVIQIEPNYVPAYFNRGITFAIITQVATYKILNKKTMFFLKNKGFSLILDVFCYKSGLETPPTREFTKSVATWVIIGDLDIAIIDFTRAIQLNPLLEKLYYNRGKVYASQNNFDMAITDYSTAIQLNPSYMRAYYHRAKVYLQQQQWEKAKTDLINVRNRGIDIIALFQNDYKSVKDFERQIGVKLPDDIAAMLIQQEEKTQSEPIEESLFQSLSDIDRRLSFKNLTQQRGQAQSQSTPINPFQPSSGIEHLPIAQ